MSLSEHIRKGLEKKKILLMWSSLTLFTGLGAILGYFIFDGLSHDDAMFSIVEGIAAGAMLTMIAETMLPEASHKGGAIIGIATLMGFLTAIFFKSSAGELFDLIAKAI